MQQSFNQNTCQNKLRRPRMEEPIQQCDNCLKMLPQSKIGTHFGYCRRNIKKCHQCGHMYDINFLEDHQEEFHKKEKCTYCNTNFSAEQMKKHKLDCSKKPKYCDYCDQNIPVIQYDSHLRQCESRTKICDKCRKVVVNRQYFVHLASCKGSDDQVFQISAPNSYNQHIYEQREKISKHQQVPKVRPKIRKQQKKKQSNKRIEHYISKSERNKKPILEEKVEKKEQPKSNGVISKPTRVNMRNKPQGQTQKPKIAQGRKKKKISLIKIDESQNSMDLQQGKHYDPREFQQNYQVPRKDYSFKYDDGNDRELQEAIMMSMGFSDKQSLPANFKRIQMNASFYRDSQSKQAAQEQIKNSSKKSKKG